MGQVHIVTYNKGGDAYVVCDARSGDVFSASGFVDVIPEPERGYGMMVPPSEMNYSDYTLDYDKLVLIGGREGRYADDTIADDMKRKNLSENEMQRVRDAVAKRYEPRPQNYNDTNPAPSPT